MAVLFESGDVIIEGLTLATQGYVQMGAYYEGLGASEPSLKATDEIAQVYGVDEQFRGDLEPGASGDLLLVRGVDAVRASLVRALVTEPGELFWEPEYGIGVTSFLNRQASAENIAELQGRIRSSLISSRFVEAVQALLVSVDGTGAITLRAQVRIAGRLVPLDLSVREAA